MERGTYQGATVIVSGAAGFIGQALLRWLLDAGARVHATSREPRESDPRVTWHQASLDDGALPGLVVQLRPDVFFHLAGRTERDRSPALMAAMIDANARPVARLIDALLAHGGGRLVTAGSGEEFGSAPGPWRASQSLEPVSPYGLSKALAADIVASAHRAFGAKAVVGRLPVVYGPGQRSNQFIPSLIAACLSGERFAMTAGEQLRDFVFVDDVVEGLAMLGAGEHFGRPFHLCTGRSVPVVEVARRVHSLIGNGVLDVGALPYRPSEAMRQEMCPDDALALLGWQARVSLDEGLRRTIEAEQAARR